MRLIEAIAGEVVCSCGAPMVAGPEGLECTRCASWCSCGEPLQRYIFSGVDGLLCPECDQEHARELAALGCAVH